MNGNDNSVKTIGYDINDTRYAGAITVVKEELDHLKKRREIDPDNLKGLALSGGGIRSASFCLGVVQALSQQDKLSKFDYMSTVSGGSYLGGSLSWLWLNKWREKTDCDRKFGTRPNDFPYGTGCRHSNDDAELDKEQAALMRHLRQSGNYLIPGNGISALSFVSVLLRSILMGFITLIVIVSLLFHLLHFTPVFGPGYFFHPLAMDIGVAGMVLYIAALLTYGYFAVRCDEDATCAYLWRRKWETWIQYVLVFSAVILLVATVAELTEYLEGQLSTTGGLSAISGALLAWFSQKSSKTSLLKIIPMSLLVYIGVLLMFIGLFVLSDLFANVFRHHINYTINGVQIGFFLNLALVAIVVWSAHLLPINKVSIHRYYRDRLMETFDPDVCEILNNKSAHVALKANSTTLYDCLPDEDNDMPYHIINSNIILVESKVAKFRSRGGDNFILSPLYSGSNATGWLHSSQFADNSITLPTAVAISGAAANSDSGIAGEGPTMNPFLSALMSIFNLRLGYWTVNPDMQIQPDQDTNPNFLVPGFRGVFGRDKLNEEANFIQLSDGGHFENLGVYELLRRHCRLIVCCDAEEDKDFVFGSLSNIIEKARVDFGVKIEISAEDLETLKYKQKKNGKIKFAKQGYLVADIIYPHDEPSGKLVYIKTTLPDNLPADVMGYKKTHKSFPDETTADQFFDEKQMEAYRMLGMHIGGLLENDSRITW